MNKFNIFLADDDEDDRFTFEKAINETGKNIRLYTAIDGEHLLHMLDNVSTPPPSVIVLDINMPKKDGITCLKEIKLRPRFNQVPVLILSTSADRSSVKQARELGARHYIQKPSNFDHLKDIVKLCYNINKGHETPFLITDPSILF